MIQLVGVEDFNLRNESSIYRFSAHLTTDVIRPRRHVLVIVNPFSGQKRGLKLWETHVEPILQIANINYDIVKTGFISSFHFRSPFSQFFEIMQFFI